ncbi:hypothetical protein ACOME3_006130 [Neoechinorhynchus agilis]
MNNANRQYEFQFNQRPQILSFPTGYRMATPVGYQHYNANQTMIPVRPQMVSPGLRPINSCMIDMTPYYYMPNNISAQHWNPLMSRRPLPVQQNADYCLINTAALDPIEQFQRTLPPIPVSRVQQLDQGYCTITPMERIRPHLELHNVQQINPVWLKRQITQSELSGGQFAPKSSSPEKRSKVFHEPNSSRLLKQQLPTKRTVSSQFAELSQSPNDFEVKKARIHSQSPRQLKRSVKSDLTAQSEFMEKKIDDSNRRIDAQNAKNSKKGVISNRPCGFGLTVDELNEEFVNMSSESRMHFEWVDDFLGGGGCYSPLDYY